ncbi:uncharacterized protein [Amphiura filiformis]|uniref:uncharacterized protein n=1 Tax=Amphiura filiformis TaxID=82378 RepID=UPI003B2138AC
MGIAIASAAGLILLIAILIFIMSIRKRKKAKSNRDDGPVNLSTNDEMSEYNGAPKPEEHAWAYSNNAMDAMGDEGIEADLDPRTENRMKHLAATFEVGPSLGPYKPGEKRANFDRQSFYSEKETDSNDTPIYGNINVGPSDERRPSTYTFFSGDLPTTPL